MFGAYNITEQWGEFIKKNYIMLSYFFGICVFIIFMLSLYAVLNFRNRKLIRSMNLTVNETVCKDKSVLSFCAKAAMQIFYHHLYQCISLFLLQNETYPSEHTEVFDREI